MKKKIIFTMLSMILIVALCQNTVAFAVDSIGNITEEEIVVNNVYNKLHFYLNEEQYHTIDSYAELVEATDYAVNHASEYAILSENSRGSEISTYQITVEFDSSFMDTEYYKALMAERETITTIDGVRDFRSRLNSFSKTYHTQLIQNNMNMLNAVDYESASPVGYSPFVILDTEVENVTASSLLSLARNNQVMNISISGEEEITPIEEVEETETTASAAAAAVPSETWENALRTINAYDIVTNSRWTGEGIRIGILEYGYICKRENAGFANVNIIPRDNETEGGDHATAVTLVATCIAPDATYYCSKKMENEWLEWFIANDCDIVNFSGGEVRTSYSMTSDAIIDYQVQAHCITFVKSAGNKGEGTGYITSPGYAYNAITVGAVQYNSAGQLARFSTSSYLSSSPLIKPNIVAYRKILDVPNSNGVLMGTSITAPQVTGCIALLLESNSNYALFPEKILSVITSTARKTSDYVDGTLNYGWFDDGVGAGILDLERMIGCNDVILAFNEGSSLGYEVIGQDIDLEAGTELQVAVAWLVEVSGTASQYSISNVTDVYLTDYDLIIYDSYGNVLAESDLIDSNIEMIRIDIAFSGTYRIAVEQWSTKDPDSHGEYVALTYNTHPISN